MEKVKQKYITVNLQLFADAEGDTNLGESASSEAKEVNTDSKQDTQAQKQEPAKEHSFIRKAFGLPDKKTSGEPKLEKKEEPAKKEEVKPDSKEQLETKQAEKTEETGKKPEEKQEQEFDEIVYNKEKVKIPVTERQTYLQKGYHYDKVKADADSAKAILQRIAESEGFKTLNDYLAELDKREKAKVAEQITEADGDPTKIEEIINKSIENNPIVKQTKEEKRQLEFEKKIATAKKEFSKDPFFKEWEPQLDELMAQNPDAPPDLVCKIIRNDYLTPEKLKELMNKEKETAEKKVLAEVHDKERRSEKKGGDTADDSEEQTRPTSTMSEIAKAFGVSANKVAQRIVKNKK